MKRESILSVFFSFLYIFLSVGCLSNTKEATFRDDALEVDSLCGSAYEGEPPCSYVKELTLYVYGNANRNLLDFSNDYMSSWISSKGPLLSNFSIDAKVKSNLVNFWSDKPMNKDKNIEIYFLLTEDEDDKSVIITFYTFSKETFFIRTSQCRIDDFLNKCVINYMEKSLDESVIESIIKYRKKG